MPSPIREQVRRPGALWRHFRSMPRAVVASIATLSCALNVLIGLGGLRGQREGVDLGIFDQALQAYSRFQVPDVAIKGQAPFNILGDHFSPVIALLAPFYRLWPDVRVLLVAQAVLFAFTVGLIGWYAWRRGLGPWAYAVEAAFALSWGVLAAADFDFHEVAFGAPVLFWALWALLEHRDAQLIVACAAMVFVKEDMPFFAAGIAIVLFLAGRRIFGVVLGAASVAATSLLIFVVIPYFSYWGHYTYIGADARGIGSFGEMAGSLTHHLASWHGLEFLAVIVLTAGLGMRSKVMLAVIPTVVFRFLANDPTYLSFRYHYGVLLTVVAFVAMVDGWQRWRDPWHGFTHRAAARLQGLLLVLGVVAGIWFCGAWLSLSYLAGHDQMVADRAEVMAEIPDGATVAADGFLIDQIVDRATVQKAHPNWRDELGAPITSDWVFLDTETKDAQGPGPGSSWVEPLILRLTSSGPYTQVDQIGRYVLLRRTIG